MNKWKKLLNDKEELKKLVKDSKYSIACDLSEAVNSTDWHNLIWDELEYRLDKQIKWKDVKYLFELIDLDCAADLVREGFSIESSIRHCYFMELSKKIVEFRILKQGPDPH